MSGGFEDPEAGGLAGVFLGRCVFLSVEYIGELFRKIGAQGFQVEPLGEEIEKVQAHDGSKNDPEIEVQFHEVGETSPDSAP